MTPQFLQASIARDELNNRKICDALSGAISNHAARGVVGEFDASDVGVGDLARAIELAAELKPKTESARRYYRTACTARNIRDAVASDDWEAVSKALVLADDVDVDAIFSEELRLIRGEANNRLTVSMLTSALQSGGATGALFLCCAPPTLTKSDMVLLWCSGVVSSAFVVSLIATGVQSICSSTALKIAHCCLMTLP